MGPDDIVAYLFEVQTWIAFLFGTILGSFLNVCAFRIPEKSFWKNQRSVCRSCGATIPAYHNIPIISYVLLRGKANCCGAKISIQYPLVEFFAGILTALVYWRYPFYSPHGMDYEAGLMFLHAFVFVQVLFLCSVIDLRLMIIPDVLSLGMVCLTPLVVFFHPYLTWQSSLIGVFLGGGVLYGITYLYWVLRKKIGMGMGDVKLLAAIGGWLGYQSIFPTLLYSSLSGSFIGIAWMILTRKKTLQLEIPFGPFLALGACLHLFFGQRLILWITGQY